MSTDTSVQENINPAFVPEHVAIIMDGNGRWAQARGLDRSEGHVEGVTTVRRITEEASELGVKFLTLYTFSTENWNRPKEEVDALMTLIVTAIERETPDLIKNNVRLTSIGDLSRMPDFAAERLRACMRRTSACNGLTLVLALSYSARWEIIEAARSLVADAAEGKVKPEDVDDALFASRLSTAGMPDPDLLIRTGGDKRISNFLLYQIAYTEIIITPTYWPDYSRADFRADIAEFGRRQRRFGLTGEQVTEFKNNNPKP
ncbi:MAG: di-trans,poly-cis-decaprenylcistransferase [Muribaculaceae bacterium]|nr:di-trans,poly-cis-decaprenylcistransferase [Muribaculaceae bacterium]MBP3537152.1 di-trans,poly-cis-decaprenylcistransferase [Muribaculaceae bacterium]